MVEDANRLDQYETVVADLVDELQRYKSAATSLESAFEAWRSLQEHTEATGRIAADLAARADGILQELTRLDMPTLVAELQRTFESHREATRRQSDEFSERFQAQQQEVVRQGQELLEQVRLNNPVERLQGVESGLAELISKLSSLSTEVATARESSDASSVAAQAARNAADASKSAISGVASTLPEAVSTSMLTRLRRPVGVLYILLGANLGLIVLVIVMFLMGRSMFWTWWP